MIIKLNKEKIKTLLDKRFDKKDINSLKELPSPFSFKDMDKSVDRIIKAIKQNEKILVVGDYDVDGIVSRIILKEFFDFIDFKISYITPDRFKDGYGISVDLIKESEANVIITVDNGINAKEVAYFCKEKNIDLIITDHHNPLGDMPAFSIINPKQDDCPFLFSEICGAQIAWYLVAGLKSKLELDFDMSNLLDLLLMAIIADVMPLISMNRALVKKSLKVFNNSSRPCILAIKEVLKKEEFTSEDIAFLVAPKINVAGRVRNASLAIDFLSEKNLDKAIDKFNVLNELIKQRRDLEEHIMKSSKESINKDDNVIALYNESFHQGVIGIVASKIADKYKKISFVGNLNPKTNIIKMSARSYGEADLYSLMINSSENLISYGGHKQAGGLSLHKKDFNSFKNLINNNFKKQNIIYKEDDSIMGILPIDEINYDLLNLLDSYEPYGHHNEKPKFLVQDIHFEQIKRVGEKKNCLSLSARNKYGFLNMIMFNIDDDFSDSFTKADIICSISKNIYKDNEYISIQIKEIINL